MYLDLKKSAYERGYASGRDGKAMWACPYSPLEHSQDYRDWMRGHADGYRDRQLTSPGYGGEYTL